MFRAALRYFSDSERSDVDRCDISEKIIRQFACIVRETTEDALSRESPRHRSSSMFFVIMRVTSCRSSFSLSILEAAALAVRVSWYNLAVLLMKVSVNILALFPNEREQRW